MQSATSLALIDRHSAQIRKAKKKKERQKNANTRDYRDRFLFFAVLCFLQERIVDLFTTVDWRDKCQHRTSRNDQAQFTCVLVSVLVCSTR